MPSALDLIKTSMRKVGALADGEDPTTSEANDGLEVLNSMLDSWSLEKLLVYQINQEAFTWTSGNASRTIGSSGNFNTTRPTRIEDGFTRISNVDYPYQVVSKEHYDAIPDKTTQGPYPEVIYYSQANPLGTIYGWPVPSASISFYLNSWKQLQQFTSLTTDLALPAGYQRAIEFNLACELGPDLQLEIPERVDRIARESKAAIKRSNSIPLIAQLEVGQMQDRRSNINIG